jgi:diaminopimelate epimerase
MVAAAPIDDWAAVRGTLFHKMSGSGNDFVMLDGRFTDPSCWSAGQVRSLCDRRIGIGADGLVILTPASPDAVRMTYWNADGSLGALCGNAALCSGRLAAALELVSSGEFQLLTDAGVVRVRATATRDNAEINVPDTNPPDEHPGIRLEAGERWLSFGQVGVPHLVIRVDDIEVVDVHGRGRLLRSHESLGPESANVNFVSPGVGSWRIRTFERGVEGETLACGTGTVAAALALAARTEARLPLTFRSRGGPELTVRGNLTRSRASDIWLQGQARVVFRGVWENI